MVIVTGVSFFIDMPQPLGSMSKDSRKIVVNWLVRLLGSAHGSVTDRTGVMPIGCGLKGNCGGSHSQSRQLPAGRKHRTASRCGRSGWARSPSNYQVMGWGQCKLRWNTRLGSCDRTTSGRGPSLGST
jgi:hypothetical protein